MWRVKLTELAKVVCRFPGCDKSFRIPSQLKQHQRIHTGEVHEALPKYRRLATAWIHCADSTTYEVTDPEP